MGPSSRSKRGPIRHISGGVRDDECVHSAEAAATVTCSEVLGVTACGTFFAATEFLAALIEKRMVCLRAYHLMSWGSRGTEVFGSTGDIIMFSTTSAIYIPGYYIGNSYTWYVLNTAQY